MLAPKCIGIEVHVSAILPIKNSKIQYKTSTYTLYIINTTPVY